MSNAAASTEPTQPQTLPEGWTYTKRTTTIAQLREGATVPIMVEIGGRGYDAPDLFDDLGDEDMTPHARAAILAAADEHSWPDDAELSIKATYLGEWTSVAEAAANYRPLHTADFLFQGYNMTLRVPGDEPRPCYYYERGRRVTVGLTISEMKARDEAKWAAAEAALTPEQRLVRDLRHAEVMRRKLRESEAQRAEALQDLVRQALDMGMSAVDIASYAQISRARVYQIRDGRR